MLSSLIISVGIKTANPILEIKQPTVTVQVEQPAPVEPSLEEKIKTNYYKCDENLYWIRADSAECLQKGAYAVGNPATSPQNTSGNTYTSGNCTWYAKSMRPDLPNSLGNAYSWLSNAIRQGLPVSYSPVVGSVAVARGYGHVGMVTGIDGNRVHITEMNYNGLGVISSRWSDSSEWQGYIL